MSAPPPRPVPDGDQPLSATQGAELSDSRSSEYNSGDRDDLRKALDAIYDYNKTLITVATGSVALSATFLKDLYQGRSIHLLAISWIVLGVSVLAGMIGMGGYVSQYAESRPRPRRGLPEYASLIQLLGVVVGLSFLAVFAVRNATAT